MQHSARDALAEVLLRYVTEVGQLAHETAELAGRTEPNAIDVIAALEELGECCSGSAWVGFPHLSRSISQR